MKRFTIWSLLAVLFANLTFTACDTSSDVVETTTDTDCAITAVTLGTLLRTIHTKNSAGADTTYNINVTGSLYPMHIDQLNNRIYNADSLPLNTHVEKVVFSTLTGTSSLAIKSLDSGNDTLFVSTDSTDFRTPRTVKVYSSNGALSREYSFEVNVHKEEADSFVWKLMSSGSESLVAAFSESRTIVADGTLYVFGRTAEGNVQLATASTSNGQFSNATATTVSTGTTLDVKSVQRFNGAFYALAGNIVVRSGNGHEWTSINAGHQFTAIMGCSADSLYAATSSKEILASADGETWNPTSVDTEGSLLTSNYSSALCTSHTDSNIQSIVYVGYDSNSTEVWKHDIDLNGDYHFPWINLPQTEELHDVGCPQLTQPSVMTYDNAVVLIGLDAEGKVSPLYRSWDYGRTWKSDEYYTPDMASVTGISAAVDTDNFIWIICGGSGEVWRGRINRLAWNEEPNSYLKAPRR